MLIVLLIGMLFYFFFNSTISIKHDKIKLTQFIFINVVILFIILIVLFFIVGGIIFNSKVYYLTTKAIFSDIIGLICSFDFSINLISVFFMLLVVIVGIGVNFYSSKYFGNQQYEVVLLIEINLFIFSMLVFVCGDSFFTLLLGWELLGLSSF
jgi:NADH:ubiquinone oxidoreductase subunit 5 (subunit L)/multisubunit Na+/H+ antiporter MnhA subunit